MVKHKIITYLDRDLFDAIEASRGLVSRSLFLEKMIQNNIDDVKKIEKYIDKIQVSLYLNEELYQKILERSDNQSRFIERIIKAGVEGQ
jgi:SAM-dependent MidA family methyltransferase